MNTKEINQIKLKEKIKEILPHGSGIDYNWDIMESEKFLDCFNSFHVMNESGFYVSIEPFRLRIPKDNLDNWKLTFSNKYRYWIDYCDLRGYLEQTFSETIEEIKKIV